MGERSSYSDIRVELMFKGVDVQGSYDIFSGILNAEDILYLTLVPKISGNEMSSPKVVLYAL